MKVWIIIIINKLFCTVQYNFFSLVGALAIQILTFNPFCVILLWFHSVLHKKCRNWVMALWVQVYQMSCRWVKQMLNLELQENICVNLKHILMSFSELDFLLNLLLYQKKLWNLTFRRTKVYFAEWWWGVEENEEKCWPYHKETSCFSLLVW